METELIESKIKRILADVFSVEEKEVVREAELIKDLGADSLDQVEAIMEIETEFNIPEFKNSAQQIDLVDLLYGNTKLSPINV